MASKRVPIGTASWASEAPKIPDNVEDWLQGIYCFGTHSNDFWRNLILSLGLFAFKVWLARYLSGIDLMVLEEPLLTRPLV